MGVHESFNLTKKELERIWNMLVARKNLFKNVSSLFLCVQIVKELSIKGNLFYDVKKWNIDIHQLECFENLLYLRRRLFNPI